MDKWDWVNGECRYFSYFVSQYLQAARLEAYISFTISWCIFYFTLLVID